MATGILFIVAAVMLLIGVPVGIALGLGIMSAALLFNVTSVSFLAQAMYSGFESLPLTAIPCFMLAGAIMDTGGLSKRLVNVAMKVVGNTTGALGTVTVLACMFFGAISGSGPATVAAIGGIMIPHMAAARYDKVYATSLSAVAGGLGVIIPPSIPFVVYAVSTNTSIGDLFLAGIGPGIVVGGLLVITNLFLARKLGYVGSAEKFSFKELGLALWDAKYALIMPVIILGGIYGGIFTPTEAAVVAIAYSILVGIYVYKELTWKQLLKILDNNASFVGGIMLTFAPAFALGAVFSLLGVTNSITEFLLSVTDQKWVILLIVNLFLIVVGMIMDTNSGLIIFAPMLLAALRPYGVDPVHLGVIMVVNLAIGFVTPPVAANLFVASGLTKIPMDQIVKRAWPFIIAMFAALILITYIQPISTFILGY